MPGNGLAHAGYNRYFLSFYFLLMAYIFPPTVRYPNYYNPSFSVYSSLSILFAPIHFSPVSLG